MCGAILKYLKPYQCDGSIHERTRNLFLPSTEDVQSYRICNYDYDHEYSCCEVKEIFDGKWP